MPVKRPTRGEVVTLRVDPAYVEVLRDHLESAIAGTVEQLDEAPGRLRDPFAARAYVAAFRRIIDGLECGEIVADAEVRAVLVEQAEVNDDANDYERVVQEHEAFAHLLAQLKAGGQSS